MFRQDPSPADPGFSGEEDRAGLKVQLVLGTYRGSTKHAKCSVSRALDGMGRRHHGPSNSDGISRATFRWKTEDVRRF